MNKNPFYEIFKGYIPKLIMIIFILIAVNNIIPFISGMRDYFSNNRDGLIFINRTSDICYLGVFLLTLIFTNNFIPQMLNIRGDRGACIKSFFKIMLIVIILALVSGLVVEFSLDYICKLYNIKAEFYTRTSTVEWLGEGMDNIFIISGIRFLNSLFFMSIAYICGSMFYRLKMKYNILVFILIPGILFGVVLNILFSNRYIGDKLETLMWSITWFVEKPIITIILEILFTVLFIIIGNKFLKNAPIAEYAHDLI